MRFPLNESLYIKYLNTSDRGEIEDKIFAAEKFIAILRLLIVSFNSFAYIFLLDKTYCISWLSYSIIVTSLIYSIYVIIDKPYLRDTIYLSSIFTTASDTIFVSLWLYATGNFHSPFYVLWYICALAVSFRYTMRVTLIISLMYAVAYLFTLQLEDDFISHLDTVIFRIGYLIFFGLVGAVMSNEVMEQIKDKFAIRKSKEELSKREQELQDAKNSLEMRVEQRTKELNDSNKQLIRINDDLDSFIYSASHDLKSPLANIDALLSMMYQDLPAESDFQKSLKEKLYFSLDRMNKTIGKLSEVAKSQKEVYDDIREVWLSEVLNEVLIENEQLIQSCDAQLEIDIEKNASLMISRLCIKSIIYNLISNAIKYRSSERKLIINVNIISDDKHLEIKITDNGLGMDLTKYRTKLFTIFKRFHNHVEGTGIGLYMVKRMIEKFDGTIQVESKVNEGAIFLIHFSKLDRNKLIYNN